MNLRSTYKAGLTLALIVCSVLASGQNTEFKLAPYTKGLTNIKDGFFELGPVFYNKDMEIKFFVRLPIGNKERGLAQVDRNSNTFKAVLAYSYILDLTKETGPIKRLYMTLQMEAGTNNYSYYPDSLESGELKVNKASYSGEFKIGYYRMKCGSFSKQWAPEFRIRYSRDYVEGDELGTIINNPNGISTVKNLITAEPTVQPLLSPALAVNYYPGKGNFTFTPAVYYFFKGEDEGTDPFGSFSRIRIETWVFYYPLISGNSGVKLGLSPFVSIRTGGSDPANKVEYGGMIQLLVGTNMLHFL